MRTPICSQGPIRGLLAALFVISQVGCGASPAPLPPQKSIASTHSIDKDARRAAVAEVVSGLDALLEAQRAEIGAPGLAAAVLLDGEVIWRGGAGMADSEAKVPMTSAVVGRAASVTKLFTGVALLMLRDEGRLSFDAPLATYLPEIAEVLYPSEDSPRITVRHLFTHTSGLPRLGQLEYVTRAEEGPSEREILEGLRGLALESPPGLRVTYSNLGAALCGILVGRVSGMPYEDFVNARILQPLEMGSSAWSEAAYPQGQLAKGSPKPDVGLFAAHHWRFGAANAAGGLYLDVDDLARFARFQLSGWPARDDVDSGPLRRASIRESQLLAGGGFGKGGHGVFWVVSNAGSLGHVVGHTGATDKFSSSIVLAPGRGVGAVALANIGMGVTDPVVGKLTSAVSAALDAISITVPAPLVKGTERVAAVMKAPTEEMVNAHFGPAFRAMVPVSAITGLFERLAGVPGPCKIGTALEIANKSTGKFRIECKGRAFRLDLAVDAAEPHLITSLRIKPE